MTFTKKFRAFAGLAMVIASLVIASPLAYAQEAITPENVGATSTEISATTTSATSTPDIANDDAALAELKSLKQKEQDSSLGFFTRLIIGFKIKQLENQLNIKKALK